MFNRVLLIALASGAAIAPASAAVNLVTNGSFENGTTTSGGNAGTPTGWTYTYNGTNGPGTQAATVIDYGQAQYGEIIPVDNATGSPSPDAVGTHGLYFVSDTANPESFSQTISGLVSGATYVLSFDIYKTTNGQANPNDSSLTVTLSNALGTPTVSTTVPSDLATASWTNVSKSFVYTGTPTSPLSLNFFAGGNAAKDYVVDRVFLGAVPEAATWAMMMVGFGMLGGALRVRRPKLSLA